MSILDKICPLCNEIYNESFECSKCGNLMENMGRVMEFADPYGAEMPISDSEEYCFHIFKCKSCGYMERKDILKVII